MTLGTFDGMHIGHQAILKKLKSKRTDSDCKVLVLTFFPHPRMVLKTNREILLLNTIEERIQLFKEFGIDYLIVQEFTPEFANLSAEDFVKDVLVDTFNIEKIVIGYDHHFGKNRSANIHDLIEFGKKYHFDVEQISAEELDHVSVSSTKIRKALDEGNVTLAKNYLGYPYMISGTVIKGKQLGRTIGFPTANIQIEENYKLIPAIGAYVVEVLIEAEVYYGMLNIGRNPTVGGNTQSVEVNIFDFEQDIYNQKITVCFLERIRDEKKFSSIEMLKKALHEDKLFSKRHIEKMK